MNLKFTCLALVFIALCATTSCKKEYSDKTELSFVQDTNEDLTRSRRRLPFRNGSRALQAKLQAVSKLKTDDPTSWVIAKLNVDSDPGSCGPTAFNDLVNSYVGQFGPVEFQFYGTYVAINQLYTLNDQSTQYFGANGENTQRVVKYQRKLEKFWEMPDEIRVNGEHNSTLSDRDKIASVYMLVGIPNDLAFTFADQLIGINAQSPFLNETPLISFDAFATTGNLIVLGDGIIEVLTETGIDNDVVVEGVLSHEWAHEVQFDNSIAWFGSEFSQIPLTPEFTRLTELQADFFSAYYLTHKRGGTYNRKRVEDFLDLFFNIGDCQFGSPNHHGTPAQRHAAARFGYNVADQTMPRGHILTADELNDLFIESYDDILASTIP